MKVDLLKLTRLNRIAVCGRCKHQFDVSVQLEVASDDRASARPPPVSQGSPMRLTPSHVPLVETPTPVPERDTVPPTSGPYRESDSPAPPPLSGGRRRSPAAGWPQSDPSAASAGPSDSRWPAATRPRLGWSKRSPRDDRDTDPAMPRAEHDTEPSSTPFGLELELDRPEHRRPDRNKKDSLVRKRRNEIVVEVGDRDNKKKRRRNTYDPDSLITNPNPVVPRVEGDDES